MTSYSTLIEQNAVPEDEDSLLRSLYALHRAHGLTALRLEQTLEWSQWALTVTLAAFFLCGIDFAVLALPTTRTLGAAVVWHAPGWLAGSALGIMGGVALLDLVRRVRILYECRLAAAFAQRHLHMHTDAAWGRVPWALVVQRTASVLKGARGLGELGIVNRLLRTDNFLVALHNADRLPVPRWIAKVLGIRQLLASRAWEVAFRLAVLPILLYTASVGGGGERAFSSRRAAVLRNAATSVRARSRMLAAVAFVLAPLGVVVLVAHTMLKYAAALRSRPSSLAARQWTPGARWAFREFNELPHAFAARLARAHRPAQQYLDCFPAEWLAVPARFGSFLVSALIGALLLLSLMDDDVLLRVEIANGRAGVWWLTVLGSVLAFFRSLTPDEHVLRTPEQHLRDVGVLTHYRPSGWKGRAGQPDVVAQFRQHYNFRFVVFARELAALLLTPVLFAMYVPRLADALVHFVDTVTVHVEGVGPVCQLALFNVAKSGDPRFGSPQPGADAVDALRAQDGKLEKSVMAFRANYPGWEAPPETQALIRNLKDFAERQNPPPHRPDRDGADESAFDDLMAASISFGRSRDRYDDATDDHDLEALSEVIERFREEREEREQRTRPHDVALDLYNSDDFAAGPVPLKNL